MECNLLIFSELCIPTAYRMLKQWHGRKRIRWNLPPRGAMPLDKLVDSVRSAAEQAGMGGEMPSLREYLDSFPRTASDGRRLTAAVRSLCSWSSWVLSLTDGWTW